MRILVMALALVGFSAHAEIYRCEVGGKVVHTDRPCAAHAQPEQIRPLNSMDAPTAGARKLAKEHDRRVAREAKERVREDAQWTKEYDQEHDKRERARNGIVERKAVRGMTEGELRQAQGNPASVSRTDTAKGATERWEYELDDGRTQSVTLSNGEVTAVLTKAKKKKKKK